MRRQAFNVAVWSGLILLLAVACTTERVVFIEPTSVPVPSTAESEPTPTFAELKDTASRIAYDDLRPDSPEHYHKRVYFIAEVLSVEQVYSDLFKELKLDPYSISHMRLTLTGAGQWEGDAVVSYESPESPLRVGDLVEIVGYYQGLKTYKSVSGSSITYPNIAGSSVNLLLKTGTP